MTVHTATFRLSTKGFTDIHDITPQVREEVKNSGVANGVATVFISGSTAGITTIEFEPGLKQDLKIAYEKIAPEKAHYHHHATWGDEMWLYEQS